MPVSEAILVGIRLRPLNAREQGQKVSTTCEGDVVNVVSADKSKVGKFQMDAAMDSSIDRNSPNYWTQERVYNFFGKRMIEHALQGFHSAVFAYGQTGTGKTTTVMGDLDPPSEHGLLLRLLADLLKRGSEIRTSGGIASVKIQMLEVYNEKVKDLLSPHATAGGKEEKNKLEIHVHPQHGVYVKDSVENEITEIKEAFKIIEFGNTMKTVAATAMNKQSSRAHTVVKLYIETKESGSSSTNLSEVFVVDLAGRENERTTLVTGERLVELTFINRSLLWLSSCITALGKSKPKAPKSSPRSEETPRSSPRADSKAPKSSPRSEEAQAETSSSGKTNPKSMGANQMAKFRNSKLTLLLYNALSGNSRTAMIGTLSPAACNYDETMSTMNFASTVKSIKLEASAATSVNKDEVVNQLKEELQKMKEKMQKEKHVDEGHYHSVHGLLQRHSKTSDELQAEIEEAARMREEALQRLHVKHLGGGDATTGNKKPKLPYLSKRSDDPALHGKFCFHIPQDANFSMGSGHGCNFQIGGLGVKDLTCLLHHDADGSLFIRAGSKQVEVEVNGTRISVQPRQLANGDIITLGHAHDFDVVCAHNPFVQSLESVDEAQPDGEQPVARRRVSVSSARMNEIVIWMVVGDARASDPQHADEAKEYYKLLRGIDQERHGSTIVWNSWVNNARKAAKKVAEANAITQELAHSIENEEFQLAMEAPVISNGFGYMDLPQFCVRLVKKLPRVKRLWNLVRQSYLPSQKINWSHFIDQKKGAGFPDASISERDSGERLICVWTYNKFCERLDQMRNIYEEFHDHPEHFEEHLQFNPWLEFGPVEMMEQDTWMKQSVDALNNKRHLLKRRKEEAAARRKSIKQELTKLRAVPKMQLAEVPPLESSENASKSPRAVIKRCQNLIAHNKILVDNLTKVASMAM